MPILGGMHIAEARYDGITLARISLTDAQCLVKQDHIYTWLAWLYIVIMRAQCAKSLLSFV